MKNLILGCLLLSTPALAATSGLNASSVLLTIYGVAISPNTDCSNATVVANFPGGVQFDFMQNPALLSGNITPGTYNCMIMKMSDVIVFTPSSTSDSGFCTTGQSVTRDVCRAGGPTYTPTTFNADNTVTFGASTACTGSQATPANDQPALFLSTGSTNTSGNNSQPFSQPTSATNGFNLGAPFVVTGSNAGTFVVNFTGKVQEQGGVCDLSPPVFSFR
jgi:hypothetical protein